MNNIELFKKYTSSETFNRLINLNNINELIDRFINEYQDYIAYSDINNNSSKSYKDLYKDIAKMKSYILTLHLDEFSNVGIVLNNSYYEIVLLLSLLSLRIVPVMLPTDANQDDLNKYKDKFDLKYIFNEEVDFNNFDENYNKLDINGKDPAIIFLSLGCDGVTKGAILSHEGILQGALNGCYGIEEVFNQTYYDIIPFFHVYGFIRSVLTPLYTGSKIIIGKSLVRTFKEISVANPSIMVLVPDIAQAFLKFYHDFKRNIFGENLKYIICGGARIKEELVKGYLELGIHLYPGYGLTEMSNMVTGNPDIVNHPDSIGLLFPNQEVKIIDEELLIKGKNLMLGYYNDKESNIKAFVSGYYKTGDIITIDNDGFLYFKGLKKDIIVLSNGENVSIKEIKDSLFKLDYITNVSVNCDNVIKINIKLAVEYNSIIEKEIKDYLKSVKNLSNFIINIES